MKKISLAENNQTLYGYAEKINGVLWCHINGKTFSYEPAKGSNRSAKQKQSLTNSGEVLAPMPGKIKKIFVQLGESVSAGQALVAMEAMKMEYTLKSNIDGVVERIEIKEGQQVNLEQLLVVVVENA